MKPTVWHLTCRNANDWHLEQRGDLLIRFDHKDDAIREAAWRAREGDGGDLVIHRADGSVEQSLHFEARMR